MLFKFSRILDGIMLIIYDHCILRIIYKHFRIFDVIHPVCQIVNYTMWINCERHDNSIKDVVKCGVSRLSACARVDTSPKDYPNLECAFDGLRSIHQIGSTTTVPKQTYHFVCANISSVLLQIYSWYTKLLNF